MALVQAVFTQISSVLNPVMNTEASDKQTLGPVYSRRRNWLLYNGGQGIYGPWWRGGMGGDLCCARFLVLASLTSPLPIIWQEKLPRASASHLKSSGPINAPLTLGGAINGPQGLRIDLGGILRS